MKVSSAGPMKLFIVHVHFFVFEDMYYLLSKKYVYFRSKFLLYKKIPLFLWIEHKKDEKLHVF